MGSSCSATLKTVGEIVLTPVLSQHPRKNGNTTFKAGQIPVIDQEIKVLLLGAGECGKSTIVKQMKIIHDNGYSEDEKLMFKSLVHSNTIQNLQNILLHMDKMGISYEDKDIENLAYTFLQNADDWIDRGTLGYDMAREMQRIWADVGVQKCVERGHEFSLTESASYFLDGIDRLSLPGYIPSEQDILRCRARTTGIVEIFFHYKGIDFRMLDVGGQRSERKKWIHCFDEAKAVIYIAALSDYDLVLAEDPSINRMKESVRLFGSICNNRWFISSSMILFLNKSDVFMNKLKKRATSIAECFPNFAGNPYDYEETTGFIQEEFTKLNTNPEKDIYTHFTCATQTNNITFVFDAVTDTLIRDNLKFCGLY